MPSGSEQTMKLTAYESKGLRRFNKFVVCVYLKLWYTSKCAVDAPVNEIHLLLR